jgi:hypothetical protein
VKTILRPFLRLWAAAALVALLALVAEPHGGSAGTGLLPDLRTVVPKHLQLVNNHQREELRFSNGLANTGDGPWQMRPLFPLPSDTSQTQDALQEILDASGNIVDSKVVSQFQFHPEHNHWHINGVALFEVRMGSPAGPIYGNASLKTTFCLIDWYKLDDNARTPERSYFDCNGAYQGISVGWVDQYHQSLEGQALNITGAPAGLYFLVSTVNPDGIFIEKNATNNTAWTSFALTRESNGNAKIAVVGHSDCEGPGLCGEMAVNR